MQTTVSKEPDGARGCAQRSREKKNNERLLALILILMVELCVWKVDNITKRLVRAMCVRVNAKRATKIHEMLDGSQKEIS